MYAPRLVFRLTSIPPCRILLQPIPHSTHRLPDLELTLLSGRVSDCSVLDFQDAAEACHHAAATQKCPSNVVVTAAISPLCKVIDRPLRHAGVPKYPARMQLLPTLSNGPSPMSTHSCFPISAFNVLYPTQLNTAPILETHMPKDLGKSICCRRLGLSCMTCIDCAKYYARKSCRSSYRGETYELYLREPLSWFYCSRMNLRLLNPQNVIGAVYHYSNVSAVS